MRRVVPVLLALVLLAALAWRSAPSAGEDAVLVLPGRAVGGPVRVWTFPWSARAVLPREVETRGRGAVDPPDGDPWPLELRALVALDPTAMDGAARHLLLRGERGLAQTFATWLDASLTQLPRDLGPYTREVLCSRRDLLTRTLQSRIDGLAPPGVRVVAVDLERIEPPEGSAAGPTAAVPRARVLYIGLDGADWEIIDALLARGELPTFRRLVRQGARADLQSFEPMMSPLLWTTAITGRPPSEHEIFDFTVSDDEGRQVPITSRFRKTPALWEILSAWDQPSAFVNFWATHPAETIDGILISDIADTALSEADDPAALPGGATWPPDALSGVAGLWDTDDVPLAELRRYVPDVTPAEHAAARAWWHEPHPETEEPPADQRKVPPLPFLIQLAANSHNLAVIARHLLEQPELGVIGVYFGDIDQVGHNFQHLAPPPHPLADPAERRFSGVVENCYRAQDAMLADLVGAAGPDTVVLIHSDHGFRWGRRRPVDILPFTRGQPVEWHRLQGVFLAAGAGVRRGVRLRDMTLYDIAPTILALRGIPPGRDMPGQVRDDLFTEPLDGERIASWDPLVGPRSYGQTDDSELDEARLEMVARLRALGYVGGGAASAEQLPAGPAEAGAAGGDRPRATYYRNQATWLLNENRFEEAERALLEANRLQPLPKTYSLLSESRAARGDLEGAIAALQEGLQAFPDKMPDTALLWIVELHLQSGDVEGARQSLSRLASTGREHSAPVEVARARLAEAEGQTERARRGYLRALELDPRIVQAAQRFAALAGSPSERARLEPFVRRALELDPRIEVYWQMLGLIRLDRGDVAGAADAFGEAGDLDPTNADYRINEALAALRAGQAARARRIYEDLAAAGSERPVVWVNLGGMRAAADDWSGALQAWQRARELGADSPELTAGIDEARRRLGRRDS